MTSRLIEENLALRARLAKLEGRLDNLRLPEKLRKSDILCRYGGEEFVLVLPDSSLANAWQCMEQVRVLIRKMRIRHGEKLLGRVTVSTGHREGV